VFHGLVSFHPAPAWKGRWGAARRAGSHAATDSAHGAATATYVKDPQRGLRAGLAWLEAMDAPPASRPCGASTAAKRCPQMRCWTRKHRETWWAGIFCLRRRSRRHAGSAPLPYCLRNPRIWLDWRAV